MWELTVKPLDIKAVSYKRSIALVASSSSGELLYAAYINHQNRFKFQSYLRAMYLWNIEYI